MGVRILPVDPANPAPAVIDEAIGILNAGGLLVAPTETRYGLLARADSQMPVERLIHAKRRSPAKPVSIFVAATNRIQSAGRLSPVARRLAERFLPGPLTLVLPAVGQWHPVIVPEHAIGVRVSSSPLVAGIMSRVAYPVTATSANISGDEENERIEQIVDSFGSDVDLYLDGGPLTGLPSTVVDCTVDPPRVLREGAIDPEAIERTARGK